MTDCETDHLDRRKLTVITACHRYTVEYRPRIKWMRGRSWPFDRSALEAEAMTKVIVDAELRRKLLFFTTPLELCDDAGQVVARLTPSTPWNDPDKWEELTPPVSDEELQ